MLSRNNLRSNMLRLACALLLLAVACSASPSRIVGGSPVTIDQYPTIAQVQSQVFIGVWTQTCSSVIITTRHVISAARCFRLLSSPRFRRVMAGTSFRNTGGIISNVFRAINHPTFSESINRDGDISIVILETPLVYSNLIQRATIVGQGVFIPDNLPVVQAGWGVTIESIPDIRAEQLQASSVVTVNNAACAANYASLPIPLTVTENMVCAGLPEGGVGACVGDAGGPLYFNDIVIGIISWGLGCTNATFPNVHTAIPSYTNWIVETAV